MGSANGTDHKHLWVAERIENLDLERCSFLWKVFERQHELCWWDNLIWHFTWLDVELLQMARWVTVLEDQTFTKLNYTVGVWITLPIIVSQFFSLHKAKEKIWLTLLSRWPIILKIRIYWHISILKLLFQWKFIF